MPNGAAPGERRGGRQKGTPNKAKANESEERDKAMRAAFALLSHDEIDKMSPAQILRFSARAAAKAGYWQVSNAFAKDAAPYYDARAEPSIDGRDQTVRIVIEGGLPDTGDIPNVD